MHHLLPRLKSSGLCVNFIKSHPHKKTFINRAIFNDLLIPYVLFLLCCVFSVPLLTYLAYSHCCVAMSRISRDYVIHSNK